MHESDIFLEDIASCPEDDAPRLIYADWLEEHGQEARATLIRLQCEHARLPWHDKSRSALHNQSVDLLNDHRDQILDSFEKLVGSAQFERGFVKHVSLGARKFIKNAQEILSREPVRSFSLLQASDASAYDIAQLPELCKVRALNIHGHGMSDVGWEALFPSPHLTNLNSLEFSVNWEAGTTEPRSVLLAFDRCPSLPGLRTLHPKSLRIDNREVVRIFQDLSLPSLERLFLPRSSSDALGLVGQQNYFPRLVELDLSQNQLNNHDSIAAIKKPAEKLHTLNMSRCRLLDAFVRNLTRRQVFPNVENLDVSSNEINASSLMYLLTSMPNLRRLIVDGNVLYGSKLQSSLRRREFPNLKEFSGKWLRKLNASSVETFSKAMRLEKLTLAECQLTDDAVEPLLKGENAQELLWLDLENNQLTDRTARVILNTPELDQLRFLNLKRNDISKDYKQAMRKKFGVGVCTFSL